MSAIRALLRRFSVAERADVSCCGLTVAQAAALEALRLEGPQRPGALCRRLGVDASTLTRNVDRLEAAGLVERAADPEDGRAVTIQLTTGGARAAARVEQQELGFAAAVLQRLPAAQRRKALPALEALLEAVREATEACCPGAFDHLIRDVGRQAPRRQEGNP
ncbi:MAG TPA: MarR family winged helix-turn-helix transcriptional regulator [Vicinamibacteria bacterium]